MDIALAAQTVFYIVSSLAILVVGGLCAVMFYNLIRVIKDVRSVSEKLSKASDELKSMLKFIVDKILSLPVVSHIFGAMGGEKEKHKKGRTK